MLAELAVMRATFDDVRSGSSFEAPPSALSRHCEERSDEAIRRDAAVLDCFAFASQ
jgi:hypothetical protein